MGKFRIYKKRDGDISVTAIVRKTGLPVLTETFTAATKTQAMTEAKVWVATTNNQIYLYNKKKPEAARICLDDFFDLYFQQQIVTKRKKATTLASERFSRNQILRLLGPGIYLCDITTATITGLRHQRLAEGVGGLENPLRDSPHILPV